jgi:putative sporulation protein YtxC
MKSICIKSNNKKILDYISAKLTKKNLEKLYISYNSFKIYDNIIIHSQNSYQENFFKLISTIITDTIIHFYEKKFIIKKLENDFFYFSSYDRKRIFELYNNEFILDTEKQNLKYSLIYNSVYSYIIQHHSILLLGFFNFRLHEYQELLTEILNNCINLFLIEREYFEFINLLKLYINTSAPKTSDIHLFFSSNDIILLDENYTKIDISNSELSDAKFLSDISFSQNDYIFNYILNILPSHLTLHLNNVSDDNNDFINTLKLIFDKKITIC